jgi:excalibur calcium-binding domain-containing protein
MDRMRLAGLVAAAVGAVALATACTSADPDPAPSAPAASPSSAAPVVTRAPRVAAPTTRTVAPRTSTSPTRVRQTDPDVVPSYRNCDEIRADHPAGVPSEHPAYRKALDRDHDGWACDPPPE